MANKDFDIKRAYEKWVEQGQPVDSDSKKESRKYAGKNNDHRSKGQEAKNGDRRAKGHEVTGRSHRPYSSTVLHIFSALPLISNTK